MENQLNKMQRKCRHCSAPLSQTLVDLGSSPLCNTLLDSDQLEQGELFYPLHVRVCNDCYLAQLDEFVSPEEIFTEYSYFSSFSDAFVEHAQKFVSQAIERFELDQSSQVVEVASNDGYLLQHFLSAGVPILGIEPALNVAETARNKGIPTVSVFLGEETAKSVVTEYGTFDLVIANNVLAHTPYLNDFARGLALLAGDDGIVSVEFPHLMRLMEFNQFDTIYHEHFSYFSFHTVCRIFSSVGLQVFDVEEIQTHGGSLRVLAAPTGSSVQPQSTKVRQMQEFELARGVCEPQTYNDFTIKVERTKRDLLECLINLRRDDKRIVGYGVPGKGNTLLNYCGIRSDFLDYMVDRNPYKQGKFTPGSRIPILDTGKIVETKPDYVLIMVWNLVEEVMDQLQVIRDWGGKFIVPIPDVRILE